MSEPKESIEVEEEIPQCDEGEDVEHIEIFCPKCNQLIDYCKCGLY